MPAHDSHALDELRDQQIRFREVITLQQQGLPEDPGDCVSEAVAEVQRGRMTALAESTVRIPCDARLLDANAAGQKVWRLRVGPVPSARVAELSATVAGLGFGRPNVVRD